MALNIKEKLQSLKSDIALQVKSVDRLEGEVKLLPVTKRQPIEKLELLYELGERHFGENQVQEMNSKAEQLPKDIHWHLIGGLQSNKVKQALQSADYIHSVDSIKLLERIDRLAGELSKKPKIFLQVNVSGEESKQGFSPDELIDALDLAKDKENLTVIGLMTMAVKAAGEENNLRIFEDLRNLRDFFQKKYPNLQELSMGMSGDYIEAIQAGSTYIRVGSALLGDRLS